MAGIHRLAEPPAAEAVPPLRPHPACQSIVYGIEDDALVVCVVKPGQRKDVYRGVFERSEAFAQ